MNKKEIYSKPATETIEMEMENVIAGSTGATDVDIADDNIHPGGDSMSKGFWDSDF